MRTLYLHRITLWVCCCKLSNLCVSEIPVAYYAFAMEASEPKFEDSAVPVTSTIRALEKEIAHPIVYQLVRV